MALAKVEGILLKNEKTRKEMLKKVYWQDKQYTNFSNGDFVKNINIITKEVSPITDGRDLFTYTYNYDDYSHEILKRYMSNGVEHKAYEVAQVPYEDRFKWEGDYFENFSEDNARYKIAQIKFAEGEKENTYAQQQRFRDSNKKRLTSSLENYYGNKFLTFVEPDTNSIKVIENLIETISETARAIAINDSEIDKEALKFRMNITDYAILHKDAGFFYLSKQLIKAVDKDEFGVYVNFKKINAKKKSNYTPGVIDNYVKDFSHNTFENLENGSHIQQIYSEGDTASLSNARYDNIHITEENEPLKSVSSNNFETFKLISSKEKSLLSKTNDLFNQHKIATLIGRFHTKPGESGTDTMPTTIDSAVRKEYGNSHGRNLLAKRRRSINGYDDPYCRVWTYHHQYDTVTDLIRPLSENVRKYNPYSTIYKIAEYDRNGNVSVKEDKNNSLNGIDYLEKNTVLGKNGFVNIAPKKATCYDNISSVEIKKCMFSIENLAWKDVPRKGVFDAEYYISDEQRGPNGGRIMWFPPYDLNFQESVNVNWNQNNFIGRGEPVFTYSNTNRSGVLSFAILVDHPSIIDNIPKNNLKNDELSDDDILRFFAGCDIPDGFNKKEACPKVEEEDKNINDTTNVKETTNLEKCKQIKCSVYFPNNYSGNHAEKPSNINQPTDKLWFLYLMFGNNVSIPTNITEIGGGYEINLPPKSGTCIDTGITEHEFTGGLPVYDKSKNKEGVVTGVTYRYLTDWDLQQKLENKYVTDSKEAINTRGMKYEDSNYIDSNCWGFNASNLMQSEGSNEIHCGYVDLIYALLKANNVDINKSEIIKNNIKPLVVDSDDKKKACIEEIIEVIQSGKKRIKKIEIKGVATSQNSENSKTLAKRRADTVKSLFNFLNLESEQIGITTEVEPIEGDSTGINYHNCKLSRRADIVIYYDTPQISNVHDTAKEDKTPEENNKQYLDVTEADKPARYETESEYFRGIKETDPLIHKKILEKFKYFNPAFHSISPEGFNARLTFLQQCTRQGHTIEASSNTGFAKTAGNLSFGRMPVCILRLGDFINTKVIINGMSINYDNGGAMQWDLNPEGIGVQPMYAKVSLQITIIGGQSLDGPINRLQNAVSFNYYANTGVYDNRSDRVEICSGITDTTAIEKSCVSGVAIKDNTDNISSSIKYRHVFIPMPNVDSK